MHSRSSKGEAQVSGVQSAPGLCEKSGVYALLSLHRTRTSVTPLRGAVRGRQYALERKKAQFPQPLANRGNDWQPELEQWPWLLIRKGSLRGFFYQDMIET